ncbi:MAG: tRNA 2-thiocytidine biosynthesis protein TtcA [Ruminococcaceae bacterium]|nr:tRNA 2-thiocytidine biosynthesis protein TtcA [Oscillospiraceae bacterium]
MRKMLSYLRRAIDDYHMIAENDVIAVGISGGKDSIVLFQAMIQLKRFYPVPFQLMGITVDLGFDIPLETAEIQKLAEKHGIHYHVIKTQIKEIVFDIRKEENPCSLCAKLRKGALMDYAKQLGCNKVALGHHYDDVVETFFMKLFYEGNIGCFSPVTYLSRRDITQIRPLIFAPEAEIKSTAERLELPVFKNPCPNDGESKRQEIKDLIYDLRKDYPDLKEKVFGGLCRAKLSGFTDERTPRKKSK